MKPFIVITTKFNGKTPIFNKKDLNVSQKRFVEKCVKLLSKQTQQRCNIAYVFWRNEEDFSAAAMPAKDVNQAEQELRNMWKEPTYPQVGDTYDRDWFENNGGDMAGHMFDMLEEGGVWPWPNAKAVFKKQGDTCVVVETMAA